LLQPDLDPVSLDLRQVLETANEPITHNFFIDHGIASIVAGNGNHRRRIEVGLVGFEGMTGVAVVLGNDRSPNENFMQVGGDGMKNAWPDGFSWRMTAWTTMRYRSRMNSCRSCSACGVPASRSL
jgi:hypothetical protein